jgi:hypothetical protein
VHACDRWKSRTGRSLPRVLSFSGCWLARACTYYVAHTLTRAHRHIYAPAGSARCGRTYRNNQRDVIEAISGALVFLLTSEKWERSFRPIVRVDYCCCTLSADRFSFILLLAHNMHATISTIYSTTIRYYYQLIALNFFFRIRKEGEKSRAATAGGRVQDEHHLARTAQVLS